MKDSVSVFRRKKIFLLVLNAGKFEILQLDVKSQAFNWFKSNEEGKRSES